MALTHFHLTTRWDLAAPPLAVWACSPGPMHGLVVACGGAGGEVIGPGAPDGAGAYRRMTWQNQLRGRKSWSGYDGCSGVMMTTCGWFSAVWQALQPAFTLA
jgi:hypothetical protein